MKKRRGFLMPFLSSCIVSCTRMFECQKYFLVLMTKWCHVAESYSCSLFNILPVIVITFKCTAFSCLYRFFFVFSNFLYHIIFLLSFTDHCYSLLLLVDTLTSTLKRYVTTFNYTMVGVLIMR